MSLWGWLFRRHQREQELDEEVQAHLRMAARERMDQGETAEQARTSAAREFGNVTLVKEVTRDMWGFRWLETLLQDLRYGARMLRRSPGFTTVAVGTLALGIGANTAIFSLINAVMLRKLPVRNPHELVQLTTVGPYGVSSFSYPGFKRLRDENHVFSGMLAIGWLNGLDATVNGESESVLGRIVSGNFFSLLGVNPVRGRIFSSEDDQTPRGSPVAVISYDYWKRRFGLDASAVGKSITLNGTRFTIVGVTPAGFSGIEVGESPDIYVPMMMEPAFRDAKSWLDMPDYHWLRIVGRLKPGVSREQARADLAVIHHEILAGDPMKDWSPRERKDFLSIRLEVSSAASGLAFALPREFSEPLFILMGMVGLVFLIACANLANLLLGRATMRKKEIAVRLAIGAGRFRLIRQLLTESVMLATAGGALGLLCAYWTSNALVALMSFGRSPLVLDLRPDPLVLGFTGGSSFLATILFGLAPALRATRVDLTPALKERAGRLGGQRSRLELGKALVVSQVTLSLLLLFGAALFVRTLENLEHVDPGFNRKNVLMFDIDATKSGYQGAAVARLYKEVLERIEAIPGVRSASLAETAPITGGGGWDNSAWVQGYTPQPDENMTVYLNSVSPKYFETLGTPLLLGRDFGPQDTESAPKVALINQTMARYFFGNSNPIGKKFGWWGEDRNKLQIEIIGVVKDAKYETLREQIPRTAYLDCFQATPGSMTFEIRTSLKPATVVSQVGSEIRAIDKDIRFGGFKTLEEHVDESLGHERLMATLSSLFGILSMLLACVGLYGVMAYAVERRTNEIGIRMALGARQMDVLWMVLRETLLLVLIGVAIGVPAALTGARLISSMLYAVRAIDPVTFVGASLALISVALLAAYIPAQRATKVDPMVALRYE